LHGFSGPLGLKRGFCGTK